MFFNSVPTLGEIVGSWPTTPNLGGYGPTLLPGTIYSQASILGIQQEPSGGFDVGTKSFLLSVDDEGVYTTITFTAGNKTLAQVITTINTAVGSTVAFSDNKFLRLKSPTTGEGSLLEVKSSSSGSDVLYQLGLIPGTMVWGGSLVPAGHPDPYRQQSTPGQLLVAEGEGYSAKAINRALFQLAYNAERSEGLLSRKWFAVQKTVGTMTYTSPGLPEGYQVSGGTYVYTGQATNPTTAQLEKLVVVLDADGRELNKERETELKSDTCSFSVDTQTGKEIVTGPSGFFSTTDDSGDIYVRSSGGLIPALLQGQLLKISSIISTTQAVIEPIVPSTGQVITFTAASQATKKIQITPSRCLVEKFTKSRTDSTRVENLKELRYSTALNSGCRVARNNLLSIPGAGFDTLTPAIEPGDILVWSGHLVTDPFNNNGTYRVIRVVDDETLELAEGEDWGPAYLNSDLYSADPGSITVTTSGEFWKDPYICFLPAASGGGIPTSGVDQIQILYLAASTFRTASLDPVNLIGGGLRFDQEADETVQKAILGIIGPSATTINAYLFDDRRNSLEDLAFRIEQEHYRHDETLTGYTGPVHVGRHRNIRPDTIDMFPYTTGPTVIVRAKSAENPGTKMIVMRDYSSSEDLFTVFASGNCQIAKEGVASTKCYISAGLALAQTAESGVTASLAALGEGSNSNATIEATTMDGDALFKALAGAENGNGRATCQIQTNGLSTDPTSIAILTLGGAYNTGSAAIGPENGSANLQFTGGVEESPWPSCVFSLRPNTSPALLRLDCYDDGSGGTRALMRWALDGKILAGTDVSGGLKGSLTVHGDGVANYPLGSQTYHPEVVAMGNGGGSSGFLWTQEDEILHTNGNQDGGFVAAFPFANSSNNSNKNWKAFKLMSESPLIERCSINKYGEAFFGAESGINSSTDQWPASAGIAPNNYNKVSLYAHHGVVIGELAKLSTLPAGWGTSYLPKNHLTIMGEYSLMSLDMGSQNGEHAVIGNNTVWVLGGNDQYAFANVAPLKLVFEGDGTPEFSFSMSDEGTPGTSITWRTPLYIQDPATDGDILLATRTDDNVDQASLLIHQGGGGDASIELDVGTTNSHYKIGIDQSDADRLKFCYNSSARVGNLTAATPLFTIDGSGPNLYIGANLLGTSKGISLDGTGYITVQGTGDIYVGGSGNLWCNSGHISTEGNAGRFRCDAFDTTPSPDVRHSGYEFGDYSSSKTAYWFCFQNPFFLESAYYYNDTFLTADSFNPAAQQAEVNVAFYHGVKFLTRQSYYGGYMMPLAISPRDEWGDSNAPTSFKGSQVYIRNINVAGRKYEPTQTPVSTRIHVRLWKRNFYQGSDYQEIGTGSLQAAGTSAVEWDTSDWALNEAVELGNLYWITINIERTSDGDMTAGEDEYATGVAYAYVEGIRVLLSGTVVSNGASI